MKFGALIHTLFSTYSVLLMLRIASSWFPQLQRLRFVQFLHYYTEPYLYLFRRVLPPVGGVLDLSPMVGYIALRVAESLILYLVS